MDRIIFDRLIDSGKLVEAEEEGPSGFELLFAAGGQRGWDEIPV